MHNVQSSHQRVHQLQYVRRLYCLLGKLSIERIEEVLKLQ